MLTDQIKSGEKKSKAKPLQNHRHNKNYKFILFENELFKAGKNSNEINFLSNIKLRLFSSLLIRVNASQSASQPASQSGCKV